MKINAILESKGRTVRSIRPGESVQTAIMEMVKHDIGSLMVIDDAGEILAIVTERDCLREVARNAHFREREVLEIATRDIAVAELDDDLGHVMDTMIAKRCRHVPVVDGGELAGILSIRDVIGERLRESRTELKFLRDYVSGVHG